MGNNPWKIQVDLDKEETKEMEKTSGSDMEAYVSTKPVVYSHHGNDDKPKEVRGSHRHKSRGHKKHIKNYGDNPAPYHISYETEDKNSNKSLDTNSKLKDHNNPASDVTRTEPQQEISTKSNEKDSNEGDSNEDEFFGDDSNEDDLDEKDSNEDDTDENDSNEDINEEKSNKDKKENKGASIDQKMQSDLLDTIL